MGRTASYEGSTGEGESGDSDTEESGEDYPASPVDFVRQTLGDEPYSKQEEMLMGVLESRRTSVVGCNGSGKDWAAARAVLWWLHTRSPAKAVVTGPTSRQVDRIVWNEIRYAYAGANGRLRGRMFRTSRYEVDEQTFGIGFATNSPHNLLGFHSPNLLVIVTEAHAVRDDDLDSVRRLNPTRLLMTGNPFVSAGVFYDSHHSRRHLYRTVQISAYDTPNLKEGRVVAPGMITAEDIADRREEWGEESPLYVGGVLGQFPEGLEDVFVPLRDATAAALRRLEPDGPVVLGCDVARFGHDLTVVIRRQGPVARIVWKAKGADTMSTAGFLKDYCENNDVDKVVIDDSGVGGGVVDRLEETGLRRARVVPFIAGAKALDRDHFYNRAAEVWWLMARAYRSGELDTDDDAALIGQVSSRRRAHTSDARIRLESKKGMRGSPDEADALAMTFAAPQGGGVRIWV